MRSLFDYLKKLGFLKILIIVLSLAFFARSVAYNLHVKEFQHFSLLADSFLQGKLYFLEQYSSWWHDAVSFGGHNYWPEGPMPAVILMPLVFIFNKLNLFFYQSYLQIPINLGVFFLVYKIAKKFGYGSTDGLFFAFAFSFASVFIGVSFWPTGWFFAQVLSTFLVWLAFKEYFTKKRLWVVGVLFGLTFLTRTTAALGVLFIFWELLINTKSKFKQRATDLFKVIVSMLPFIFLYGLYNHLRFGNPIEQGYNIQSIAGNLSGAKDYGLFSLAHIPGNIYYFLFAGPVPIFQNEASHVLAYPFLKADPWGLGLIFTSPYLLYLIFLNHKDKFSLGLVLTILTIAVPIFLYYGIGWYQFGYRYSLDFLPLVFILFMRNYKLKNKSLSAGLRWTIIASALFNLFLFSSIFKL